MVKTRLPVLYTAMCVKRLENNFVALQYQRNGCRTTERRPTRTVPYVRRRKRRRVFVHGFPNNCRRRNRPGRWYDDVDGVAVFTPAIFTSSVKIVATVFAAVYNTRQKHHALLEQLGQMFRLSGFEIRILRTTRSLRARNQFDNLLHRPLHISRARRAWNRIQVLHVLYLFFVNTRASCVDEFDDNAWALSTKIARSKC